MGRFFGRQMRHISTSSIAVVRNTAAHITPRRAFVLRQPKQPTWQPGSGLRGFSTGVAGASGGGQAKALGHVVPVRVKLPGRGDQLEVVDVEGTLVSHAKKAVINEFKQLQGYKADQVDLLLGGQVLSPTRTLKEAGLTGDSTLVVAVRPEVPMPMGKKFTIVVSIEDEDGTMAIQELSESVASVAELEKLEKKYGGGALVLESDVGRHADVVKHPDQIKEGETYVLLGGQQEAVRRHRTWTEVADTVMKEEALTAVIAERAYGHMEEFKDYDNRTNEKKVLNNNQGVTKEFDGIAVNGTHAVALECKHRAEPKHVTLAMAKAKHLEAVAAEGRIPRLASIKTVVPVLAAKHFSAEVQRLCQELSVGVVKPNGKGLSFIYKPTVGSNASTSSVGT